MSARPFLFISARPEVEAVGPEYESVRRASGLDAARLEHLRLDIDPLETVDPAAFAGIIVGGSPFNVTTAEERKHPVQRRVESELAQLAEGALDTRPPAAPHVLRHRRAHAGARRNGGHAAR